MENIIKSIETLFTTYGFKAAAIIVATIIIVNFIKKPITKKAIELSEKKGYDKSIITKNITFLPLGVAFILTFCVELVCNKFNFKILPYTQICSSAVLYSALATATYEAVKKQLEAYSANKIYKATEKQAESNIEEVKQIEAPKVDVPELKKDEPKNDGEKEII